VRDEVRLDVRFMWLRGEKQGVGMPFPSFHLEIHMDSESRKPMTASDAWAKFASDTEEPPSFKASMPS
jgi:hypothetical protein